MTVRGNRFTVSRASGRDGKATKAAGSSAAPGLELSLCSVAPCSRAQLGVEDPWDWDEERTCTYFTCGGALTQSSPEGATRLEELPYEKLVCCALDARGSL